MRVTCSFALSLGLMSPARHLAEIEARALEREMRLTRNQWAHQGSSLGKGDDCEDGER